MGNPTIDSERVATGSSRVWRWARRALIALCALATLTAIVYRVEYWRGKQEWERAKQEVEAQGAILNWDAYLPPSVPDEQNVFKAPNMADWFVGRAPKKNFPKFGTFSPKSSRFYTNAIASITIVAENAKVPPETSVVFVCDGSDEINQGAAENFERAYESVFGPILVAPRQELISAKRPSEMSPIRIGLRSDSVLSAHQVNSFLRTNVFDSLQAYWFGGCLTVASNGPNSFLLFAPRGVCNASDFIQWSKTLDPELEQIRQALQRPFARMEGDYEHPALIPIPNFVGIRCVAQDLAQRVQCQLLLGRSKQALSDLTLFYKLRGFLEAKPTGRPMTLVSAMINVAVTGLYVQTIADGLRMNAWSADDLATIQQQLSEVDLPPIILEAFRLEQASLPRFFETTIQQDQEKLLPGTAEAMRFCKIVSPRGWLYQNMALHVRLLQQARTMFDPERGVFNANETERKFNEVKKEFEEGLRTPYNFYARCFLPNWLRAAQATAFTQTEIDQAFVACALERYRVAHKEYPETLGALVPQFAEKIPCDIIGGKPLRYSKATGNGYLLYSVGWNEADDHGERSFDTIAKRADWVWQDPLQW